MHGAPRYPSRFILDVDESLLNKENQPTESLIRAAKEYIDLKLKYMPEVLKKEALSPGTKVYHDIFGPGVVQDFDEQMNAHIIKFDKL